MQIYLADPDAFICDKLILYMKNKTSNKTDFLRLLFSFDDVSYIYIFYEIIFCKKKTFSFLQTGKTTENN